MSAYSGALQKSHLGSHVVHGEAVKSEEEAFIPGQGFCVTLQPQQVPSAASGGVGGWRGRVSSAGKGSHASREITDSWAWCESEAVTGKPGSPSRTDIRLMLIVYYLWGLSFSLSLSPPLLSSLLSSLHFILNQNDTFCFSPMRQKIPRHYVRSPAVCQRQFRQGRPCSFGAAAADKLPPPILGGKLNYGPIALFRALKKPSSGSTNPWEIDPEVFAAS